MRPFVVKVLKTGVPVALLSAAFGYGLACFAGTFADAQAAQMRTGDVPSARMKVQMPLVLGGISFAILVALEGAAALVRAPRSASPAKPTPRGRAETASGMDAEVEALLNQILAQTEAEKLGQTPMPENSSATGAPRSLSTTH